MCSATTNRPRGLFFAGVVALLAVAGGWFAWQHHGARHRAEYVLINETGQPDYDLAFTMSLKLAEKNPKDDAAVDALAWVVTNVRSGEEANKSPAGCSTRNASRTTAAGSATCSKRSFMTTASNELSANGKG